MNKRKIFDFLFILNLSTILYLIYFILKYLDLANKNQIKSTNINIYFWILILNIFIFVKRLSK